jgi:hypothetical protein
LGLWSVARLKNHLPELFAATQKRFLRQPPHQVFRHGQDRVEIWDADDFAPWETLRWQTVRVVRYRQYKPNGTVHEAYWLTDFPRHRVSSRAIFRMAFCCDRRYVAFVQMIQRLDRLACARTPHNWSRVKDSARTI